MPFWIEEMMEMLLMNTNVASTFTSFPDLVIHYLNTKN
jgi:hypothetical protein